MKVTTEKFSLLQSKFLRKLGLNLRKQRILLIEMTGNPIDDDEAFKAFENHFPDMNAHFEVFSFRNKGKLERLVVAAGAA